MANQISLKGRVFLNFDIQAVTGLHIGGSETGIEIGGVDKTVIRDPLTNRPYIPGSSLRGKMRSLLEKYQGKEQNQRIGQGFIHSCTSKNAYSECDICQVFGVPGERDFATPTRLLVRDTPMDEKSAEALNESGRTDLPYTEVKTEVSIDRVTSAANPRQIERVPAGTNFKNAELVFSIFDGDGCDAARDIQHLKTIAEGMQLLEDDYLGGSGSRGSGKVTFKNIQIKFRDGKEYLAEPATIGKYDSLSSFVADLDNLVAAIQQRLNL